MMRKVLLAAGVLMGLLVGSTSPASAATTPVQVVLVEGCDAAVFTCASTHAHWSGNTTQLAQSVTVGTIGRVTYLALGWNGGYTGVQTDGNSVSGGVVGPTAVFSMGGAGAEVRPLADGSRNPNCETGFDGNPGVSCRVQLGRAITAGDQYQYSVEPVAGGWFRGSILRPDGVRLTLADLRPSSASPPDLRSMYNFVEYFGSKVPTIADVPFNDVKFSPPSSSAVFTGATRLPGVCAVAAIESTGAALLTSGGSTPCSVAPTSTEVKGFADKCLDVRGPSTDNGTAVQLWDCVGVSNQKWFLTALGEVRGFGNKCLEVSGGNMANGTAVQMWDCNGTAAQRWTYTTAGELRAFGTKCLEVRGPSAANGTVIQIGDCVGATHQKWRFGTVPAAPLRVLATAGNGQATVSWSTPASNGGTPISSYTVASSPGGHSCTTTGELSCTVTGLANGTSYTFTVGATNAVGSGPASIPSNAVIPSTAPEAPTVLTATPGNGQATVTWTAPASNGGSPINRYTVTGSPGGQSCSTTGALTCTVTGLANGTSYTFTVVATNTVGNSPTSTASAPVVPAAQAGVPGAAAGVAAAGGNAQAAVSWTAPASNGGSVVTGYTVTSSPAGQTCSTSGALLCTVTGLTNGTSYTFTVVATNAAGPGPASTPSNAVVPAAPAAAGDSFHPLTPARILDSRPGSQVGPFGTRWGPGQAREVTVTGAGGVAPAADAVVLNVTVTGTTAAGYLTIWPAGQAQPNASSLNWAPGQTIPNAVTVKVGTGGKVSVFNAFGEAHVIIDVVGYYDTGSGDGFTSLTPARVLDSRAGAQVGSFGTPWSAGVSREVTVAGVGGVPAGVDAVVVNVTVTGTTAPGYLTIWPAGQPQPVASSLNWSPGQTIPNAVTVKVGAGGRISVFNATGDAHVIVDVVGSFAPGTGSLFHPLSPARIQDSRPGAQVGPHATPWGADVSRDVQVTAAGGVPSSAAAVLMNMTATGTTASSFLTVWPAGQAAPLASSLNWGTGDTIPNSVTAKLSPSGGISVKNAVGMTHVIADIAGWYG